MSEYKRTTIMVKTPDEGAFLRVEGVVQRGFYSYQFAQLFDQQHVIYIEDDIYYVLVEGQPIARKVAENLARSAHSGQVKVTKFLGF